MKQLDLTDWQNAKWETRDGRPVRLLCVDAGLSAAQQIVGIVADASKNGLRHWPLSGSWYGVNPSGADLIRKPKKIKMWVNIYASDTDPEIYLTEKAAKLSLGISHIACIPIEFEEGEGL